MKLNQLEIASGREVNRAQILTILQVAVQAGEARFVRLLTEDWLNAYPYDLPIEYLRARALLNEGNKKTAIQVLIRITELDPEYVEAQELLAHVARRVKGEFAGRARSAAIYLRKPRAVPNDIEDWAQQLIRAGHASEKGKLDEAESKIQAALLARPSTALPAISHLRNAQQKGSSWLAIQKLLELYREQWPHSLIIKLMHAEKLLESGFEDEAIDIMHECVAEDVSGQVARRLWGKDFRFSALWPKDLKRAIRVSMPAKVTAGMGWNHLESGIAPVTEKRGVLVREKVEKTPKENPEHEIEEIDLIDDIPEKPIDLEALTTQTENDLNLRADKRSPSYVILTTKEGLRQQYGESALNDLDASMRHLAVTTSALPHWSACLIYADDQESVEQYGLQAAKASDPWEIKNLISDLDQALGSKGEMIGALLIVGGPNIVPFHHLPNPVDDEDKDVPSDNPYASIDENYFIPSWPIGRLPGGKSEDPKDLIKSIQKIAFNRATDKAVSAPILSIFSRILRMIGVGKFKGNSFGYTAEVWRRASHSVYRPIGEPKDLSISPPAESGKLPKEATRPLDMAYFNLHGLEEKPEWYGQRDPIESTSGPDYPIALSPKDIVNSGRAPQIVFSEACFGAHIIDKSVENTIALKFLASGSKAIVGSTCTSYGSITTPLIAADLLGQTFWKLLSEGHTAGEALRRAKIALARSMHHRQGYLDGEDQKTLISFVLYGDPLAQAQAQASLPKRILRSEQGSPDVSVVCDKSETRVTAPQDIPEETMKTVRSVVSKYLPGMKNSGITLSHEHLHCEGHDCPIPHPTAKGLPGLAPDRRLVTLSKHNQSGGNSHPSYARITMDSHGKVVKLAVSR